MDEMTMKVKNYIELHCYIEGSCAKDDVYELSIIVGKREFGQDEHYTGRPSAMRALKTLVTATGLPWVENKSDQMLTKKRQPLGEKDEHGGRASGH